MISLSSMIGAGADGIMMVAGDTSTEEAVAGGIKGAGATMGAEEEAAGTTEEAAEGHLEFVPDNLEILELAITWQI